MLDTVIEAQRAEFPPGLVSECIIVQRFHGTLSPSRVPTGLVSAVGVEQLGD